MSDFDRNVPDPDARPAGDQGMDDRDLMALADGRIDNESTQAAAIRAYLTEHPEDAERVAAWQQQNDAIRAHYAGVLAEPLPERLRPEKLRAMRARKHRSQLRVAMAASFAAVVLAGVVSLAMWQGRAGDMELNRFAADVASLSGKGALASQVKALERTPEGLRQSGPLPDLDAVGFSLKEQRVVRTGKRTATEARYEDAEGNALRLFVAEESDADAPTLHRRTEGAREIVYWRQGGRLFALSAEQALQPGRLEQIATATIEDALGSQPGAGPALAEIQGELHAEQGQGAIVTMDGGQQRAVEPAPGSRANVHYDGMVKDSSL